MVSHKYILTHLFAFVFLDVLGFSIILPLIPYYSIEFHSSSSTVGLLLTANALAQLLTAPWIGRLSDVYGRKRLLLVCVCATLLSFLMMYGAQSLMMLFASRILDGLLGGNISLAQACIADITGPEERAKGFGLIGAAFGLAFIFGPALGALIFTQSHNIHLPPLLAAVLSLLNLIGIYFFLPEFLPSQPKESKEIKTATTVVKIGWRSWWWFHFPLQSVNPTLFSFYVLRFFHGLIFSLFETTFGLYTSTILNLSARASNLFFVYIGIIFSFSQVFIRRTSVRSESKLIGISFVGIFISMAIWPLALSPTKLLFVLFPFSLASGLLNALINTAITKSISKNEQGAVLGISASLGGFARVFAPIIGAYLFDRIGYWSPYVCGSLMALSMVFYGVKKKIYSNSNLSKSE